MSMDAQRTVVASRDQGLSYPGLSPFDPGEPYPEYPFATDALHPGNRVYGAVREVLRLAGLDASLFGSPVWNPLGDLVGPGGTVLIKPNWVRHYHIRDEDIFGIITHPAVLRPLIDYAFKAVGPGGRVWVMDAPLFDTDFSILRKVCQLDELEQALRARGVPVTIADMRSLVAVNEQGVIVHRERRETWASEGVEFDLGPESALAGLGTSLRNVFGSDYDRRVTASYHTAPDGNRQHHRYRISRRALEADLVISVPKLKTHKKTGVTLNVKNMIGINTDKNYIPHYRVGAPLDGGDEFPDSGSPAKRLRRRFVRHSVDLMLGRSGGLGTRAAQVFMKTWLPINRSRLERRAGHKLDPVDVFYRTVQGDVARTGDWWGNDTCWRCGLDINTILRYGTTEGLLSDRPMRRYFSLIDGIVGGEGEGPSAPTPRGAGVLVAGFDPIATDIVATQIMGFDPDRIRDLRYASGARCRPLTDNRLPIVVCSNRPEWQGHIEAGSSLAFQPHPAWASYLRGDLS
jgi:uncharacterized protein (DUF362 family)